MQVITKLESIETYLQCATLFVELLCKHYTHKELTILLKDIAQHTRRAVAASASGSGGDSVGGIPGQLPPSCLPSLERIMTHLVTQNSDDMNAVVTSDEFLALLDLFHGDRKLAFCKNMLKVGPATLFD